MEHEHFTKVEAEGKVGKKIRTTVAWSGVPKETTGQVVRADAAGRVRPSGGERVEVYDVGIQWDLPTVPATILHGSSAGEPFTLGGIGKLLVDWFTKSEYEKYIIEL